MESTETSAQTSTAAYAIQDLTRVEGELKELLAKRTQLQNNLDNIENSLYNLETSYIEDSAYGNIIRGYDGFLTARAAQPKSRLRHGANERIFSASSVSYQVPEQLAHHTMDESPPHRAQAAVEYEDDDFVLERSVSHSHQKKKKSSAGPGRKKRAHQIDDDDEDF
ncbi:Chromatin modification- protein meaf6 [Kappamyces sp. JEL0829]|nr:Chromatin modification- protein meaf6 [Kappamyces sp. JEL0829]